MKYVVLTLAMLASLAATVPAKATSCVTICNTQGTWCSTSCV